MSPAGGEILTPTSVHTDSDPDTSLAGVAVRLSRLVTERGRIVQDGPTRCLIGLGGNVGPVDNTFVAALEMLDHEGCRVISRSQCHRSAPMGTHAGGTFTNAAACIITDLSPLRLLDRMQEIEHTNGRVRTVHWGPRPLDLDLLFYGQESVHSERLRVPHPDLWYRRFVLDPLVEIAPDWKHPKKAYTINQLRGRLDQRPLIIEVDGAEVLPLVPDRYSPGTALIRASGRLQSGRSSVDKPFCEVRVRSGDQQSQESEESKEFHIDVRGEDLPRLIDVILSAAVGK